MGDTPQTVMTTRAPAVLKIWMKLFVAIFDKADRVGLKSLLAFQLHVDLNLSKIDAITKLAKFLNLKLETSSYCHFDSN